MLTLNKYINRIVLCGFFTLLTSATIAQFCCDEKLEKFFDEEQGKYGFKNKTGAIVIPPNYQKVNCFDEQFLVAIAMKEGKYGVIDSKGKTVVEFKYDLLSGFCNTGWANKYAKVGIGDKYGMIDNTGAFIVPLDYEYVGSTLRMGSYAMVEVKKNGKWYVINNKSKIITPELDFAPNLNRLEDQEEVTISSNGKKGTLHVMGNVTFLPEKYTELKWWNQMHYYKVRCKKKVGLLNSKKEEVLPCEYEMIRSTSIPLEKGQNRDKKVLLLKKEGKIAIYTRDLKPLSGFIYTNIAEDIDDVAVFERDGNWYRVAFNSEEYQENYYTTLYYQNGCSFGCHGWIDHKGKTIVKPIYNQIYNFYKDEGYFQVEKDKKWGIVSVSGEIIIPLEYEKIQSFYLKSEEGANRIAAFALKKEGKIAVYSRPNLKQLTEFKYDSHRFKNGYKGDYLKRGDKYYMLDKDGKEILVENE